MSENDDTDTIRTTEGFTPNSTILSWRLRLGYAELYATLAPNMINAVITAARETQPACRDVDDLILRCREVSKPLLGAGDFERVIQALCAKLPFDDPDVDGQAQEILMCAITQFYPEFVLGLGDAAYALLPSGGGDTAAFAERMLPKITELIMCPMMAGRELPERLREKSFKIAVATLQGKLLAEPALAPFTLRADARALARRALWWQYASPDDAVEDRAIEAARDAIQERIQREQLNRHQFTYSVILQQPADGTSLRDAYAPYVAHDVPWDSIEDHLVPTVGSVQDALRREDLLVHITGHAGTAVALSARIRAVARALEPAKRLCWFMSTVQYSHNAIEELRLAEGESGDFATFESWEQELEVVLAGARGALEICAAASHLGASGFIRRGTGTWPMRMLLQLFSAADVEGIFGGTEAMHALMSDPVFSVTAGAWFGDPGEPALSEEATRRRLEPAVGIRLMEWACGLRALFSIPVYAAFAEGHDYVKRVLGLEGVQCASDNVDDSYIATRPWDEVLAMTTYDGGGKGLAFVGIEIGASPRVLCGRVACVHLTYATTDDRYLMGKALAPVVAARDTCCVCLETTQLDACLQPCRHKVCGTCARKLGKCPLCRERVVSVDTYSTNKAAASDLAEAIKGDAYLEGMMNHLQNGLTAVRAVARLPRCARQASPSAPLWTTGAPEGLADATHCAVTMLLEAGRKVTYFGACDDIEAMERAGPSRTPFSVVGVTDVDGAGNLECSAMGCPKRQGEGTTPFSRCGRCKMALYCSQACQRQDWKHQHREQCPRYCALSRGGGAAATGGALA